MFVGIYSSDCPSNVCTSPSHYDYSLSNDGQYVNQKFSSVFKYDSENPNDPEDVSNYNVSGNLIRENFRLLFDQYNRQADIFTEFLSITNVQPPIVSVFDGFIGLLPVQKGSLNNDKNFFYWLQQGNMISH